jgi:hypothetical protein
MTVLFAILFIAILALLFLILATNAVALIVSGCADLLEWFYDRFYRGKSDAPLPASQNLARYLP